MCLPQNTQVRYLNTVPVTKETILQIVFATVVPLVPLVLTMMSLEELLKTVAGVLF